MISSRKTPLYQEHIGAGARMADFHGWSTPVFFSSILEESKSVRENVGMFDISHMGEVEVKGEHAFALLQNLTSNDLRTIEQGQAQYTALLNENGGILDDLLVYKISEERFFLCLNASNTESDVSWIADQALQYPDVEVRNLSRHYGMISIQGPNSESLLRLLTRLDLSKIGYYHFVVTLVGGHSVILSRTGYTGEDGFEIFCEWRETGSLWKQARARGKSFGLKLIGLGARDILRLEMGYPLHGADISADTTPYEAGLGWIVKMDKPGGFAGHAALEKQKEEGIKRTLVGIEMIGRGVPRPGYPIVSGGVKVGEVTSGSMSPTLGKAIGLGYAPPELAEAGTPLFIDIRGKMEPAVVKTKPFVSVRVKKPALPGQGERENLILTRSDREEK